MAPILTYTSSDFPFQPLTKIYSADINECYTDIQTLLNTTGLDDTNIQVHGLTRVGTSSKLKAGTANVLVCNDSVGNMAELSSGVAGSALISQGAGNLPIWGSQFPTGAVIPYSGISVPSAWLLCDGSAVSRTTYSTLFSALSLQLSCILVSTTVLTLPSGTTAGLQTGFAVSGTGIPANTTIASLTSTTITLNNSATTSGTYTITFAPHGVGNGSTTFNLPNMQGRVAVGPGGTIGANLGAIGGEATHTLVASELPVTAYQDSGHVHGIGTYNSGGGANGGNVLGANGVNSGASTNGASANISNPGGGGAHNNVQPYTALSYIIKI